VPGAFEPKVTITKILNFNLIELLKGRNKYSVTNTGGTYIYGIGSKVLPPYQKTTVYLLKSLKTIDYEDLNGTKYSVNL
jgi:hypothetical protein